MRGARRNISLTSRVSTMRCRRRGRNSPTGTEFLVGTKERPSSSARMMRPLSLRNSRWLMTSLTLRASTPCYAERGPVRHALATTTGHQHLGDCPNADCSLEPSRRRGKSYTLKRNSTVFSRLRLPSSIAADPHPPCWPYGTAAACSALPNCSASSAHGTASSRPPWISRPLVLNSSSTLVLRSFP